MVRLVLMGDPAPVGVSGPRTLVRQCPSTRIPSPSPTAAAACLATSGPPALFGTRRAARCPSFGHDGFPRPARCVAPRLGSPPRRFPGIARLRDMRLSWPLVVSPPSARYRGCGGPCLAMRRPPTLQRCSMALGRHPRSGDAITPGSLVPARRLWRQRDAGHSSTASPRRHQLFPYRNACRCWPEGRFSAPSLPELRIDSVCSASARETPWENRSDGPDPSGSLAIKYHSRAVLAQSDSCLVGQLGSPFGHIKISARNVQ